MNYNSSPVERGSDVLISLVDLPTVPLREVNKIPMANDEEDNKDAANEEQLVFPNNAISPQSPVVEVCRLTCLQWDWNLCKLI